MAPIFCALLLLSRSDSWKWKWQIWVKRRPYKERVSFAFNPQKWGKESLIRNLLNCFRKLAQVLSSHILLSLCKLYYLSEGLKPVGIQTFSATRKNIPGSPAQWLWALNRYMICQTFLKRSTRPFDNYSVSSWFIKSVTKMVLNVFFQYLTNLLDESVCRAFKSRGHQTLHQV